MALPTSFRPKSLNSEITVAKIVSFAKRRRYFSISIISWIVVLILVVTILVPSVQRIFELRAELAEASAAVETKRTLIANLQTLDIKTISRDNLVLSAAIPVEKPVLPVLYSIDRLATEAKVSVANFQVSPGLLGTESGKLVVSPPKPSQISPQLATLPLKMTVAGGFEAQSAFFQSLDRVVPFIQINSIQFASDLKQTIATGSGNYSAEVALSSLYLKTAHTPETITSVSSLTASEYDLLDRLTIANNQRIADSAAIAAPVIASNSGKLFGVSQ